MKRKPSKRSLRNRQIRKFMHEVRSGTNMVTLGDFGMDTIYFDASPMNFTFENGGYITIKDLNADDWGTKIRYGKHPSKVHPARRNKEKKKVRIEANITSSGQTVKIIKVDADTWVVEGDII